MRPFLAGALAALALAAPAAAQAPGDGAPAQAAGGGAPAQPAPAEDAAAAPAVGDSFDYVTSGGRKLRLTLTQAGDGRFVWELHDVTGTPVLAARITQDAEFRVLAYETAGGDTTSYDPNNCEKVIGICTYTVHHPDGSETDEQRINGIEDEIWNYSLWKRIEGEMTYIGTGEICYDAAGISLREAWTPSDSAAGYSLQRIRPDGTLADCSNAAGPG